MSFYKFDEDDLFTNTVEAYPQYRFYTQSGSIYINDMPHLSGANTNNITGVPKKAKKEVKKLKFENAYREASICIISCKVTTRLKDYFFFGY